MKKVTKVALGMIGLVLIGLLLSGMYSIFFLPVGGEAIDVKIEQTPERIERGQYLANHVSGCLDCHSIRDWSAFAGPITGNPGGGGEKFGKEIGFPGIIYTPNITPYNLGGWTDGEIFRSITAGVDKDGNALFPIMPYHHFGQMDKEDIYSIIAYIRTLDTIKNNTAARKLNFPLNFLVNTMPKEAQLKPKPDQNNQLAYGGYLVNAAGCLDCHSKKDKGGLAKNPAFGGGKEFKQMAGIVRSPNITFDRETGIGHWTKDTFVNRFKVYAGNSYKSSKYTKDDLNSPMPWHTYSGLTKEDLEAIYMYLQSLPPVKNTVIRYEKWK